MGTEKLVIASRERIFLGIPRYTVLIRVLSQIVYFLAEYELALRVRARRSESEIHVLNERSYDHDSTLSVSRRDSLPSQSRKNKCLNFFYFT